VKPPEKKQFDKIGINGLLLSKKLLTKDI